MQRLKKIVSGMCQGADIGGSIAAKRLGWPTGGYVYNGSFNAHPEWETEYGCEETGKETTNRTTRNAREWDATLHFKEGNEVVTWYEIAAGGTGYVCIYRPWFEVRVDDYDTPATQAQIDAFKKFMKITDPETLNIAGNANSKMQPWVEDFIERAIGKNPAAETTEVLAIA